METHMYWILFGLLVVLLSVFSIYLVLNVVKDCCFTKDTVIEKRESLQRKELIRYHFDKNDVEDLTKIEGDLTKIIPRISLTNEVDTVKVKSLLKAKSNYNGENTQETSNTTPKFSTKTTRFVEDNVENNYKKKQNDISKSIDNLEYWDPTSIEVMKSIHAIEMKAKKMEESMKHILGHVSDLQYYQMNEQFIRLQIDLCDIHCETEELRKRKTDVFGYIQMCQLDLRGGTLNKTN